MPPLEVRQPPAGSSLYCSALVVGSSGVAQMQPAVSGGKGGGAGDGGWPEEWLQPREPNETGSGRGGQGGAGGKVPGALPGQTHSQRYGVCSELRHSLTMDAYNEHYGNFPPADNVVHQRGGVITTDGANEADFHNTKLHGLMNKSMQ